MVLAIVAWNYWAPLIVAISTDTLAPERIGERVREISAPSVALLDDQIATQDACVASGQTLPTATPLTSNRC